jgi:protein-disulfide isomerase
LRFFQEISVTNARTVRTAREKAAEMRAEAARKEARRRSALIAAVVAVVLAVAVGVTVLVRQAQHQTAVAGAQAPSGTPQNIGGNFGIPTGPASTSDGKPRVVIEMYEDFQCPICKEFEAADGAALKSWQQAGIVRLVYHPVAFLDRASTTNYSTRALEAAVSVQSSSPSSFQAFHDLLYANQPAEGSAGLPDSRLADLAAQAGADRATVAADLSSQRFKAWTVQATDAFSQKYAGTPTVLVDGKQQQALDLTSLRAAVAAAASAKGLPAPK